MPLNPFIWVILSTSFIIDDILLEITRLPWCTAIAQKEQPPKQPLWLITDVFIVSRAFTFPLIFGCTALSKLISLTSSSISSS